MSMSARRSRPVLIGALLVLGCWSTRTFGQSPLDFSGHWVPVPGRTLPEGARDGPPITIVQDAVSITITGAPFSGGRSLTYRLDGSEIKHEIGNGNAKQSTTATARWVDRSLVITNRAELFKQEETYSFERGSGYLVVSAAVTQLHSSLRLTTLSTTRVYKKRLF
jgi:hypothetical protein